MKRHYRNMTPEKAEQIRAAYFSRQHNQKELAKIYNIGQSAVSRIVSNLTWNKRIE